MSVKAVPHFVSEDAPAHRAACRCDRYAFPHRRVPACSEFDQGSPDEDRECDAELRAREARQMNAEFRR